MSSPSSSLQTEESFELRFTHINLFSIRVTLYAEFLPMRSRATCILLIEVRVTCCPDIHIF